jgi:hypothetical protein
VSYKVWGGCGLRDEGPVENIAGDPRKTSKSNRKVIQVLMPLHLGTNPSIVRPYAIPGFGIAPARLVIQISHDRGGFPMWSAELLFWNLSAGADHRGDQLGSVAET